MSDTDRQDFTFDEISVWDWYDGVVRATGKCLHRPYFIILAAWHMTHRRKAYLLTELPPGLANELKSLEDNSQGRTNKQETWDSFSQIFENYLRNYTGNLYLSFDEPEVGKEISSRIIPTKHLSALRDYDFEKTLSDTACQYWFGPID